MALETTAIIRAIMLQILKSDSVTEAYEAVKVMGTQDDEAVVMEAFHKWQERERAKQEHFARHIVPAFACSCICVFA